VSHTYLGHRLSSRLFVARVGEIQSKRRGFLDLGRRRKSTLIDGAGDDARDLSDHLASRERQPEAGLYISARAVRSDAAIGTGRRRAGHARAARAARDSRPCPERRRAMVSTMIYPKDTKRRFSLRY
jgi:hypothetical protein